MFARLASEQLEVASAKLEGSDQSPFCEPISALMRWRLLQAAAIREKDSSSQSKINWD
jgi:hypothetical protein